MRSTNASEAARRRRSSDRARSQTAVIGSDCRGWASERRGGHPLKPPSWCPPSEELGAGPTEPEAALGLRSDLSDGNLVAGVELDGGIAAVDPTEDFSSLSGTEQALAIGQVVLSLTARPGVGRVVFTLDGERVEVPRGDGALTSGSVSRDTYLALLDGGDGSARPTGAPTGSVADMVAGAQ